MAGLQSTQAVSPSQAYPLQSGPMFAARTFCLNFVVTATVAIGVRAISTKTTTIKG
jgi:hypothetical protein